MSKKSKIMDFFSLLGRSLLMPIAALAACGIVLGLTSALMKDQVQAAVPFLSSTYVYFIISTLNKVANVVFTLLPVLFAISIAFGMAKEEKEIAAFAGFIGYYTFLVASSCMVNSGFINFSDMRIASILGVETMDMGAVAGIIIGLLTAWLHNKYHKVQFPVAVSFYGGKRFVAIAVIMGSALVGLIAPLIWEPISAGINGLGDAIGASGLFGVFGYGFLERLLIPTGLHHVLNGIFRTTAIGGVYNGVEGCLNIFLQFIDQVDISELAPYTVFLGQGKMPMMMFGLPGAAYAIYRTAPEEKKAKVKALMIAGVAASVVSGITEPMEFSFMFVAPVLFVFHAVMGGLSFMSMAALNVIIGNTGGGLIDYFIWGIFQPGSHWYWVIVVGIPYFFIYYFVFKWYLTKKNISIEVSDDDDSAADDAGTAALGGPQMAQAYKIIEGLGGTANIVEAGNCLTRLRVDLVDPSLVREDLLKKTGSMGFVRPSEKHIQVIYGPKVETIAANVREYLKHGDPVPAPAQAGAHELVAPVSGQVVPMKECKDETFASCMMGDGVVIHPTDETVKAPCNATVSVFSEENIHAIGLTTDDGVELLIHIGIDTVNLKGEGFKANVTAGQKVKAGDTLLTFSKSVIEGKGLSADVMLIVMAGGNTPAVTYTTGVTAEGGKTVVGKY